MTTLLSSWVSPMSDAAYYLTWFFPVELKEGRGRRGGEGRGGEGGLGGGVYSLFFVFYTQTLSAVASRR